jgi:hypothetical protein
MYGDVLILSLKTTVKRAAIISCFLRLALGVERGLNFNRFGPDFFCCVFRSLDLNRLLSLYGRGLLSPSGRD